MIIQCASRWELGARLGEGGFGQVFAARAEDGREAAAKLVAKVPGAQRELLFVELGVARNIVPIIDSGETEDHWVLIMPMAERSLGQELQAANALPVEAALVVLTDIADALAGIDGRVVHRDLKPDNVLLLHGVWCLADFGISRYAEATTAPDTRKRALSPPYAAPERWRSERATSAADVYALGVIAYELLTGRLPFPGPTTEEFGDQHLHAEPPRLTGVSARLAGLIEECLYKAPGARPTPANLQARLAKAGAEPRLAGAAKLAGAYQVEAARVAEQIRTASLAQTEGARRAGLLDASRRGLRFISDQLLEHLGEAAPTAPVQRRAEGWNMSLNGARLGLSVVQPFDGKNWVAGTHHRSTSLATPPCRSPSRPIVRATRDEATPSTTAMPTSPTPTPGTKRPSCSRRGCHVRAARTPSRYHQGPSQPRLCGRVCRSIRSPGRSPG